MANLRIRNDTFTAAILLLALLVLPSVQASFAGRADPSAFQVTAVSLTVVPARYEGPCPAVIKFSGNITANGKGVVRYTFIRSDGATGPVFTLTFDSAGRKSVETTWTLGGPTLPTYSGWEAIKILSPNEMVSNRAGFRVVCRRPEPQTALDLTIGKQIIKIGGEIGGAGAKAAISGGTITLMARDSFMQSAGKCAFNITYELVAYGTAPTSPIFLNRVRSDNDIVSIQSNLALKGGESKLIQTQAYLPAGTHLLTLTVDDENTVTESNEANNVVKIRVIVQCPGRQ
jgi:hypothetical protein